MRVVALLLAVALIVVGGFWLARDRAGTPGTATPVEAQGNGNDVSDTNDADAADASVDAADPSAADDDPDDPAGSESDAETDAETAADQGSPAAGGEAGAGQDEEQEGSDQAEESPSSDAAPDQPADSEGAEDDAAGAGGEPAAVDSQVADPAASLPEGYEAVPFVSETPQRVFDQPEQVLDEGTDYVAVLSTNRGDIVVELYEDRTPATVNNFVFLALNRYYQGVPFHRVLEDFMAQTGDPTGTGSGGPGYEFEDEIVEDLVFDSAGILAMANAGPGTNGSQFFITFAPTPWLNGGHTIFGHVLQGEELLAEIARVDPASPSAIVRPEETLADLAAQGIDLPGDPEQTVESAIGELVGTTPVAGQSFTAAGYRGVLGQVGENPAYGFFNQPDTLLNVVIGRRPTS